jgi:hypothetical protein
MAGCLGPGAPPAGGRLAPGGTPARDPAVGTGSGRWRTATAGVTGGVRSARTFATSDSATEPCTVELALVTGSPRARSLPSTSSLVIPSWRAIS